MVELVTNPYTNLQYCRLFGSEHEKNIAPRTLRYEEYKIDRELFENYLERLNFFFKRMMCL